MQLTEIVDHQTNLLRSLFPPVEAFGIGGSYGQGTNDRESDVDFFLLIEATDFFKHLVFLRERLPALPLATAQPGYTFLKDFGFKISFILSTGVSVQYFINTQETFLPNPMRMKTKVLYDPSGLLTACLKELAPSFLSQQWLESLTHCYLEELLKLRKFLLRQDLLPALDCLAEFRLILLSLDRQRLLGALVAPHDANRDLAANLGRHYVDQLSPTFASPDYESVYKACLL